MPSVSINALGRSAIALGRSANCRAAQWRTFRTASKPGCMYLHTLLHACHHHPTPCMHFRWLAQPLSMASSELAASARLADSPRRYAGMARPPHSRACLCESRAPRRGVGSSWHRLMSRSRIRRPGVRERGGLRAGVRLGAQCWRRGHARRRRGRPACCDLIAEQSRVDASFAPSGRTQDDSLHWNCAAEGAAVCRWCIDVCRLAWQKDENIR